MITSKTKYKHSIATTLPYFISSLSKVSCNNTVYHLNQSINSSVYDNSRNLFIHLVKVLKKIEQLIDLKEEHHDKLRKFSLGPIQTELLNINSEHPYSEGHFEITFQDKISPSDQSYGNRKNS